MRRAPRVATAARIAFRRAAGSGPAPAAARAVPIRCLGRYGPKPVVSYNLAYQYGSPATPSVSRGPGGQWSIESENGKSSRSHNDDSNAPRVVRGRRGRRAPAAPCTRCLPHAVEQRDLLRQPRVFRRRSRQEFGQGDQHVGRIANQETIGQLGGPVAIRHTGQQVMGHVLLIKQRPCRRESVRSATLLPSRQSVSWRATDSSVARMIRATCDGQSSGRRVVRRKRTYPAGYPRRASSPTRYCEARTTLLRTWPWALRHVAFLRWIAPTAGRWQTKPTRGNGR